MPEIFISYARSTERDAQQIGEALRELGYSVWRDDELPAHRDYSDVIEERLRAARAVVVVWSAEAVRSQWVRAEAEIAREAGTLVQLRLDAATLPMPFNRIQCADLCGWSGDVGAVGWRIVAASVDELVRGEGRETSASPALQAAAPSQADEPLLAVLAFDNLSGDPEMAYFSDGVSQEILDTVARRSRLKVIAPSSSFQLRGADKAVRKVVANLSATHLLDGAVRRAGSRVRISAHLVECVSDTMLWSDRYDRELADVFALQDEIAQAVASALDVALKPARRHATIRPEVYERYLRARKLYEANSSFAFDDAVPLLEQVVAEVPTFAAAWENLAMLWASRLTAGRSSLTYAEVRAKVVETARNALDLDPFRGRAMFARSLLQPRAAYAANEAAVESALARNPNDPLLVGAVSGRRMIVGRLHEGLVLARQAMELDPLHFQSRSALIIALDALGRHRDVMDFYEAWLLGPHPLHFQFSGLIFSSNAGDWERFDRWDAVLPKDGQFVHEEEARLRRHFHRLRARDATDIAAAVSDFEASLRETGTIPLAALRELASYGRADEAFRLAEAASFDQIFDPEVRFPGGFVQAMAGLFTEALTSDPRFPRLCAKLGLVSYWLETDHWPDCGETTPYDFRSEARKAAAAGLARRR